MLDNHIIEQLKEVFKNIKNTIELRYTQSEHSKQGELITMLKSLASTTSKIFVSEDYDQMSYPHFKLYVNGEYSGVSFSGIPGGHEFSSLVLAILNSDKQGKFPDEVIIERIQNIKGPIKLKTYISLSCENCPDVVQALNLMAILRDDFTHEMVDGEFVGEEIENLGIQGVPAIVHEKKILNSGKIDLVGIIEKLEADFGKKASQQKQADLGIYDVIVIGGGPAGASSAIYTARKGLKTAIITDRIGGQLQDTKGIENLISVPFTEGPELSNALNRHINEYDIKLLNHRRVKSIEQGELKRIELNSTEVVRARSIIIATGAKWRELGVDGESEYIGRGVAYCPHCDGPLFKGKNVSVIGGGNSGVEAAIDLAGIAKSVTLLEFSPELKADTVLVRKLESLSNINVIKNAKTNKIIGDGSKVTALEFEHRGSKKVERLKLDGVFVQIGLIPNTAFLGDLIEKNSFGEVVVTDKCRTSANKIYAAGDVTTIPYKQIIIAMGEGAKAGLSAFEDLAMV